MMNTNNIYNLDCLEGMSNIDDHSIDMILCDMPYGTTENKWDTIIDLNKLWEHYKRIIKPLGAIVLTSSQPFTSKLISSNYEMYRYSWVWVKDNATGFTNAHCQPLRIVEDVCVFSFADAIPNAKNKMTYNAQNLIPYNKMTRRGSGGDNYNKKTIKTENFQEYKNWPNNMLNFPRDKQKLHPTQKPVALFEYLIKTYTNEGDTVLDNCIGSGTTAIACINTYRKYIGFEINKKYYEIAKQRIEDYQENMDLFETKERVCCEKCLNFSRELAEQCDFFVEQKKV